MTTILTADAVVMTAPNGCTKYLLHAVEQILDLMDEDTVLEVPCDSISRIDIAEWCLSAGRSRLYPGERFDLLFIRNTRSSTAA